MVELTNYSVLFRLIKELTSIFNYQTRNLEQLTSELVIAARCIHVSPSFRFSLMLFSSKMEKMGVFPVSPPAPPLPLPPSLL